MLRRRPSILAAAVAIGLLALPARALACDGADAQPGAADRAALEAATVCLINAERAAQGVAPLGAQDQLRAAAAVHADDMVARRYFAHESPEGATLTDRIRVAGWLPDAGAWRSGENLAWGTGTLATPREIVAAWMRSAGHRANILEGQFDEVGLAITLGAPQADAAGGGTYVADFGARDAEEADVALAPVGARAPARTPGSAGRPVDAPETSSGGGAATGPTTRGRTGPRTAAQRRAAQRAAMRRRCLLRTRRARAAGAAARKAAPRCARRKAARRR